MRLKSYEWVSHRTMKITRTGVTRQSHTECKSTKCTERALRCGGDRSAQVKKMLKNSRMPSAGEDRTDIAGIDVSILGVVTHVRNIRYNGVSSGVLSRDPHQRPSVRHRLRCRRDPHQWPSDVGIYSWICNMNVTRVKPRVVQVQI